MSPALPWEAPTVLFTFDDGWSSTHDNAFPIFEAAGVPATIYVNSVNVGNAGICTLADLQEMYAAGWDVGNHTNSHPTLTGLTEAQQETEIETCAAYLETNEMPRCARHIAYPSGAYNTDTLTAMAARSMRTGRTTNLTPLTTYSLTHTNPLELQGVVGLEGTVASRKAYIDAAQPGQILVFVGHKTEAEAGSLIWPTANLSELVAYAVAQGCRVVTISQLWDYMQAGYVWP